jgi:hypothetical protein
LPFGAVAYQFNVVFVATQQGGKQMRRLLLLSLALAGGLAAVLCGPAAAAPDSATITGLTSPAVLSMISTVGDDAFSTMSLSPVDPSGTPTQHYGPYPSGSPDSGTCGNNWAEDTFDRDFTVRTNAAGTTVVEQFKNGSFVTNEGPSPGACDSTDGYGPGTLQAGHTGSMHGYFTISGTLVQTSTSPFCNALTSSNSGCDTATFINTHFVPCYGATCNVTTYFDHYSAGDQGLAVHEWKNASCDRGGNHGDIADLVLPPGTTTVCA